MNKYHVIFVVLLFLGVAWALRESYYSNIKEIEEVDRLKGERALCDSLIGGLKR